LEQNTHGMDHNMGGKICFEQFLESISSTYSNLRSFNFLKRWLNRSTLLYMYGFVSSQLEPSRMFSAQAKYKTVRLNRYFYKVVQQLRSQVHFTFMYEWFNSPHDSLFAWVGLIFATCQIICGCTYKFECESIVFFRFHLAKFGLWKNWYAFHLAVYLKLKRRLTYTFLGPKWSVKVHKKLD